MDNLSLDADKLHELCMLTNELIKLRQAECPHLVIENLAPELLGKIITEYLLAVE